MKLLMMMTLIFLVSCNIKEVDDLITGSDSTSNPGAPILRYNDPASSPSNDSTPSFHFLNSDGGGTFFLSTLRVFADSSCRNLVTSYYVSGLMTDIQVQLELDLEGIYTFTANYTDYSGATSDCSSPLTYKYESTALRNGDHSAEGMNYIEIIGVEVDSND